jgi:hypothetical protein
MFQSKGHAGLVDPWRTVAERGELVQVQRLDGESSDGECQAVAAGVPVFGAGLACRGTGGLSGTGDNWEQIRHG